MPLTVNNVKYQWCIYCYRCRCCCCYCCGRRQEGGWQTPAASDYAKPTRHDDAVGRGEETQRCRRRHSCRRRCCCSFVRRQELMYVSVSPWSCCWHDQLHCRVSYVISTKVCYMNRKHFMFSYLMLKWPGCLIPFPISQYTASLCACAQDHFAHARYATAYTIACYSL